MIFRAFLQKQSTSSSATEPFIRPAATRWEFTRASIASLSFAAFALYKRCESPNRTVSRAGLRRKAGSELIRLRKRNEGRGGSSSSDATQAKKLFAAPPPPPSPRMRCPSKETQEWVVARPSNQNPRNLPREFSRARGDDRQSSGVGLHDPTRLHLLVDPHTASLESGSACDPYANTVRASRFRLRSTPLLADAQAIAKRDSITPDRPVKACIAAARRKRQRHHPLRDIHSAAYKPLGLGFSRNFHRRSCNGGWCRNRPAARLHPIIVNDGIAWC